MTVRIAYFDPFAGASGDMLLGALVDAGWPITRLQALVRQLDLPGASVNAETVFKQGIRGTLVRVETPERAGNASTGAARPARGLRELLAFVARAPVEEVEECINQFPGVKESRVFGRAHPHLGQVPGAEVVLDSPPVDVEAIKAHCARMLSPYKVPLDVTVVPGIPRTPGGKIQRRPSFDVEAK